MTEKFALQQTQWNGSAIYLYKSLLPSWAVVVYEARDEFLAGSRVALDDYGAVRGCNHLSLAEHILQLATFRNNLLFATSEGSPVGRESFRRVRSDTRVHTSSLSLCQVFPGTDLYFEVYCFCFLKSTAEL